MNLLNVWMGLGLCRALTQHFLLDPVSLIGTCWEGTLTRQSQYWLPSCDCGTSLIMKMGSKKPLQPRDVFLFLLSKNKHSIQQHFVKSCLKLIMQTIQTSHLPIFNVLHNEIELEPTLPLVSAPTQSIT